MQPTRIQYFFAADGPLKFAWALGVGLLLGGTIVACEPAAAISADPWNAVPFLAALVLAVLLGLLGSTLLAGPLLGPLYWAQGLRNGAPYEPGDIVQILVGPHRGTVTGVWDVWPSRNQIRLDLGAAAREQVLDVFCYTEVVRVPQTPLPEEDEEEGGVEPEGSAEAD